VVPILEVDDVINLVNIKQLNVGELNVFYF